MKLSADLWMLKTNASPKDSGGDDDVENKEDISDGSDEKWDKIIGP